MRAWREEIYCLSKGARFSDVTSHIYNTKRKKFHSLLVNYFTSDAADMIF